MSKRYLYGFSTPNRYDHEFNGFFNATRILTRHGLHGIYSSRNIGFCYADRNDWHQALEWNHRVEAVLLSAPVFNPNLNEEEYNEFSTA